MKKLLFVLIPIFFIAFSCYAQDADSTIQNDGLAFDEEIATDLTPIPDSKEFDADIAREFGGDDLNEIMSENDIFGFPIIQKESLLSLGIMFLFNLIVCWIIVHFLYYRRTRRKDHYFTFMLFSTTVFLLMALLNNVNVGIGFAMGLFAIFGMIRYRTEPLKIREMTYLFVTIGISVINGLAMSHGWINLLVINILFIVVIIVFDYILNLKRIATKIVLYEKINLVKHGKEEELIADLKERTGLDIQRVEVGHIDFLRDVAYVKIYYVPFDDNDNTIDTMVKNKDFMG